MTIMFSFSAHVLFVVSNYKYKLSICIKHLEGEFSMSLQVNINLL